MKINSHILKIQGRVELPHAVDMGHNYHVSVEGSINKEEIHDNEDGTCNRVSTFKPIKVSLLTPKGESLKLKDPRKNSQKLRNYLFKLYTEEGYIEDFDRVYDEFTNATMAFAPSLLKEAIKRINEHK